MPTYDVHRLLSHDRVAVGLTASDKADAIERVVDLLVGHPAVTDLDAVRQAVREREAVMSTGVGQGLGLPHAKTSAVTGTVGAFASLRRPVPFDAIDGEPVQLLFLLVGPEGARAEHLRLLGRISRLMNRSDVRDGLLEAGSPGAVLDLLRKREAALT